MVTTDTLLADRIAVITGGTHGVGRGIAQELIQHGATVFVTGRSASPAGDTVRRLTRLRCDHRDDRQVETAFAQILATVPAIDILVNPVWGCYDDMIEDGVFTWPNPFWDQPLWRWDTEKVMTAAQWPDLSNSESPEFTGRAVVAPRADSGRCLTRDGPTFYTRNTRGSSCRSRFCPCGRTDPRGSAAVVSVR